MTTRLTATRPIRTLPSLETRHEAEAPMNTTSLYVLFLTMALALASGLTTGGTQQTLLIVMACSAIAAALTAATEAAGNRAKRKVLATSAARRSTNRSLR